MSAVLGKKMTSDSLNEGLPIKWPDKSFKGNCIFFHAKDSKLSPLIIR